MPKYIEAVSAATTIAEKHGIPIAELVDTFAEIPDADAAPVRHGRWYRPYISWFFPFKIKNPYCYCTNCAQPIKPKRKTNYCPGCGAKMDGEAETQQPHGIDAFLDECPICSNKNSELCDECRCEKRGAFLPENKLSKRSAADAAEHKTIRERFEAAFPRCRIDEYGEPAEICPASLAGKECPATDKRTCMNCPAWDWPAE